MHRPISDARVLLLGAKMMPELPCGIAKSGGSPIAICYLARRRR
jgi:hypothetical protein